MKLTYVDWTPEEGAITLTLSCDPDRAGEYALALVGKVLGDVPHPAQHTVAFGRWRCVGVEREDGEGRAVLKARFEPNEPDKGSATPEPRRAGGQPDDQEQARP